MSSSTSFFSAGRGGEDLFPVLGLGLPLGELDDRLDLGVGDEGALHAHRLAGADRHEEGVTHADELLRARLVEDDPAVGEAGGGERQPRRHVGLDQAGDDVDRRALRGQHQVDAGGTRLLGDPDDRLLDVARGDHHQVGELVDDREDVRVGRVDPLAAGRGGDLALLDLAVEVVDVPDAGGPHVLVALLHLLDQPGQRGGGLLGVGDDRRDQVRDAVVGRQLDHLRVDQDHPQLVGRGPQQQRGQQRVDAAGLTGTGRTGDQQVRHLRQVGADEAALDVLAEADQHRVRVLLGRLRAHDVAEADLLAVGVGHLDADGGLAGDRREDPDVVVGDGVGEVAGERGDLLDLDRRAELHLVAGDRRAAGEAGDGGVDVELLEDAGDRLDGDVVGLRPGPRRRRPAAARSATGST